MVVIILTYDISLKAQQPLNNEGRHDDTEVRHDYGALLQPAKRAFPPTDVQPSKLHIKGREEGRGTVKSSGHVEPRGMLTIIRAPRYGRSSHVSHTCTAFPVTSNSLKEHVEICSEQLWTSFYIPIYALNLDALLTHLC